MTKRDTVYVNGKALRCGYTTGTCAAAATANAARSLLGGQAPEEHCVIRTPAGKVLTLPIETVQYHPESIGTPEGVFQLRNFFGLGEGSKSPAETVAYHEFRGILRGDYTERELSALGAAIERC